METLENIGRRAKAAAQQMAVAGTAGKNRALEAMAASLEAHTAEILAANAADLEAAAAAGMSVSLQDRLRLTADRIAGMAAGVREIIALTDPVR